MTPYMRAANVTWNGVDVSDVKEMDFTPKEQAIYRLEAGDILLSEASGSAAEVGKPAIWREEIPGACFQNTLIRVRSKGPLPEFLHYHFLNDAKSGRFATAGKGIGINHLGADRMSSWPLTLPPIDVQRRIVAKLDELLAQSRAAREQLEAVPALVEQYRQSVLAAAFRGDLTADWRKKNPDVEPASKLLERIRIERRQKWEAAELAKLKAKGKSPKDDKWKSKYVEPEPVDTSDLPELPPTWCWASIGEIAEARSGIGFPPRLQGRLAGKYPFAKVGDLSRAFRSGSHTIASAEFWVDESDVEELNATTIPERSILFPKIGESIRLNYRLLTNTELLVDNNVMAVIPNVGAVDSTYVLRYLQTVDFYSFAVATAVPSVRKTDIEAIAIPLAPLELQQGIVANLDELLSNARKAREQAEAANAYLQSFERSLLAKAFRGELVA